MSNLLTAIHAIPEGRFPVRVLLTPKQLEELTPHMDIRPTSPAGTFQVWLWDDLLAAEGTLAWMQANMTTTRARMFGTAVMQIVRHPSQRAPKSKNALEPGEYVCFAKGRELPYPPREQPFLPPVDNGLYPVRQEVPQDEQQAPTWSSKKPKVYAEERAFPVYVPDDPICAFFDPTRVLDLPPPGWPDTGTEVDFARDGIGYWDEVWMETKQERRQTAKTRPSSEKQIAYYERRRSPPR